MAEAIKPKQYDSIQLMRGIACITVIFMHIIMFKNGEFGVDLFFCISGFIMMHVTRLSTKNFLLKRAIRIVPLYWLVTFATAALAVFIPQYFRTTVFSPVLLLKSLFFIPFYSTGPSGNVANALVHVGWTLVLEVFFYLLFFISMKINQKYRAYISTLLLLILVVSGMVFKNSESVFLSFYARPFILEFSFGMFLYKFLAESNNRIAAASQSAIQRAFCLIGATAIWAFLFAEKYIPFFSGVDRIIKYGIPAAIVFILIFKGTEGIKIPKLFIVIGNISYSVYLTHNFVIQGFSRLIYSVDTFSIKSVILVFAVIIPLVIGVGYVSWYIVENKLTSLLRELLIKK